MKILHVLPALTKGGAEKVVVDLANTTSLMGNDVTVLVGYLVDPLLMQSQLHDSINFRSIYKTSNSKFLNYILLIPWIFKNWKWIKNFDILHCHLSLASVFGSIVYVFRLISNTSNLVILETNHSVGMPLKFLQKFAFNIQLFFRDGYVLMANNSNWTKSLINKKRLLFKIIPNGIELHPSISDGDVINSYKFDAGIKLENSIIIGNVGRLVADRRPMLLLDIFSKIHGLIPKNKPIIFFIGGDGPERESLQRKINNLGLNNIVVMPGIINNPLLAMSIMDLYISLNVGEITGIAGIEAVSQGVPVIALQMSDDYVCSDLDWIWSSIDTLEIATKAVDIIANPILRSNICKFQFEYLEDHLTAEKMTLKYINFYNEIIKNKF